jgi:hypothetical protein
VLVNVVNCLCSFEGEALKDGAVESGFSAFEYGELCIFGFGHFIRLPALSVKSELWVEVPIHVNLHVFVSTGLGQNVSAGRNALAQNAFSLCI